MESRQARHPLVVLLAVCVTCLLTTTPSIGETHGTESQRMPPQLKYTYLAGIIDSWSHISIGAIAKSALDVQMRQAKERTGQMTEYLRTDFVISPIFKITDCIGTRRMKSDQIFAIVQRWVDDHPQDWHNMMPDLAMAALGDACKDHEILTK